MLLIDFSIILYDRITRNFSFHIGGDSGEELYVTLDASLSSSYTSAAGNSLSGMSNATGTQSWGVTTGTTGVDNADTAITTIDEAIDTLSGYIQKIGDTMVRLAKKESFLSVSVNNTDAVRSTYEDADFAVEQMELLKLQILQNTSVTSLAQANSAPQVVLSLFR